MDACIATTTIKVYVQENGIIRINETGLFIGRLDGVKYEELAPFKISSTDEKIIMDRDQLEILLNCMANQKYIHEQNAETQREWQEIIDKSYHKARSLLSPPKAIETNE